MYAALLRLNEVRDTAQSEAFSWLKASSSVRFHTLVALGIPVMRS